MWKWRWNSFIKNTDIKWISVTEVSLEVSEKDMVGYYLENKISVFDRGRTMDCVVGEVVVRVQHPQLLRLQHVLVPRLQFWSIGFSKISISITISCLLNFFQSFDHQCFKIFVNLVFLFDAAPFCNQDHAGRHRGSLASRHWRPSSSGSF